MPNLRASAAYFDRLAAGVGRSAHQQVRLVDRDISSELGPAGRVYRQGPERLRHEEQPAQHHVGEDVPRGLLELRQVEPHGFVEEPLDSDALAPVEDAPLPTCLR